MKHSGRSDATRRQMMKWSANRWSRCEPSGTGAGFDSAFTWTVANRLPVVL